MQAVLYGRVFDGGYTVAYKAGMQTVKEILEALKASGMTQTEIAAETGMTQANVSRLLDGQAPKEAYVIAVTRLGAQRGVLVGDVSSSLASALRRLSPENRAMVEQLAVRLAEQTPPAPASTSPAPQAAPKRARSRRRGQSA